MPFPGPWIQPPDSAGSFNRLMSWQGWSTTFADGAAYPAYPGTAVASADDADSIVDLNGWFLHFEDLIPDANGFPDTWVWTLREGFLGADVQWYIDNHPTTLMPPVPPGAMPAGAVGYEYENPYGAATGPVEIASRMFFETDAASGDPAFPPAGDWLASTFRLRLIPSTVYTLNHAASAPVVPSHWLPGAVTSGYPLVAEIGFDGTGHAELDLAVTAYLSSLDAGAYTLLIVSSLLEDEATPPTPQVNDASGNPQRANAHTRQDFTGDVAITATVHYRPPRYRFLYNVPQTDLAGAAQDGRVHFSRGRP